MPVKYILHLALPFLPMALRIFCVRFLPTVLHFPKCSSSKHLQNPTIVSSDPGPFPCVFTMPAPSHVCIHYPGLFPCVYSLSQPFPMCVFTTPAPFKIGQLTSHGFSLLSSSAPGSMNRVLYTEVCMPIEK